MRYSRFREGLNNSNIEYYMDMTTENRGPLKLGQSIKFIYDTKGGNTYPKSHPLMMDAKSNYSGGKRVDDEFNSATGHSGEWEDLTRNGKLTYTFTPSKAKTYYWYCFKHPWMKGKIIVTSGGGGSGGGGSGGTRTYSCSKKKKNIKTKKKWKKLCRGTQKQLCKSAKKRNKFKKKYCKGKKRTKNKYLCKLLKKNVKKSLCN